MAKKNHKNYTSKKRQDAPAPSPTVACDTEPCATCDSEKLSPKTLLGIINTDLYDKLLAPPLSAAALDDNNFPLQVLIENIVEDIAAQNVYDTHRKLDDICQRFLYYIEALRDAPPHSREFVELNALCNYWRAQFFMTAIKDAQTLFNLLLPETTHLDVSPLLCPQNDFFNAIHSALSLTLSNANCAYEKLTNISLFDFAHGTSFPWLGFNPDNLLNIRNLFPDHLLHFTHAFALSDAGYSQIFAHEILDCLKKTLLIDLVCAQHRKLFAELELAFDTNEPLPDECFTGIQARVRFDKTYQSAFERLSNGLPLLAPLHRASRLNLNEINMLGKICSVFRAAQNHRLGVFIFHFLG